MKVGLMELLLIFIVALFVIGPDKLPGFAKKLGAGLREFKKATGDMTKEVRENILDPLQEAQEPLRKAAEPLEDLDREIKSEVRDLERDIRDLGKGKSAPKKASDSAPDKDTPAAEGGPSAPGPDAEETDDQGGEKQ